MKSPRIRRFGGILAVVVIAAVCTAGCAGETAPADNSRGDDGGSSQADTSQGQDATSSSTDAGAADTSAAGPQPPKPFKYTGGDCPKLIAGANKIFSWDGDRGVDIFVPKSGKDPGLLFAWHGLGDSKEKFGKAMNAQGIADLLNVIVAVPQSQGSVTGWGWTSDTTALRDSTLFDDLLTCIDQQWDIDNHRVFTTGFSAGGLWSSYLVCKRSTFLAAALIWSGGTGPKAYEYKKPKRQIPVLLAWGGKEDFAFLNFDDTAKDMSKRLRDDGHVVITCDHGGKHTIPFGGLNWGLKFLNAHRWDTLTKSPFVGTDLGDFPKYCTLK